MADKINTDWHWTRGDKNERYRPAYETPNLFVSFVDLYASIETRPLFDDPTEARVDAWISRYGRLYSELGEDPRDSGFDSIAEHSGVMAWCFRTINKFKELDLDHNKISIFDADRIRLELENPMRFVPESVTRYEGAMQFVETRSGYSFPAAEAARTSGVTRDDAVWSTAYSVALGAVRGTIEMFLANELEIRFGTSWKLPRDRYGRLVRDGVDYSTVYHSQATVTEPKSLVGFMFYGLLEYLQDPFGIEYYECSGFDWCGQWLHKKPTSKARRLFCTDACRARKKRSQK